MRVKTIVGVMLAAFLFTVTASMAQMMVSRPSKQDVKHVLKKPANVAVSALRKADVPTTTKAAPTAVKKAVTKKPVIKNTSAALKASLSQKISSINPKALELGIKAYQCASKKRDSRKDYLTIIDYTKPSSQKRMYVIDMKHEKLVSQQLVAHGANSGGRTATKFSNRDGSHQTSLGVFVTGRTYQGKNGLSLRLNGLDRGYNDKAKKRAIVIHGANYVNQGYVSKFGMVGRSWGCPAIDKKSASSTINTIKNGSVVFAYYKDNNWMNKSNYLHCTV